MAEIGFGAGFETESVFHRQFLNQMRMTPGAYRALDGAEVFLLHLPAGYRAKEILAYHARDPLKCQREKRRQPHLESVAYGDGPAVMEISIEHEGAWVKVHATRKLGRAAMAIAACRGAQGSGSDQ